MKENYEGIEKADNQEQYRGQEVSKEEGEEEKRETWDKQREG